VQSLHVHDDRHAVFLPLAELSVAPAWPAGPLAGIGRPAIRAAVAAEPAIRRPGTKISRSADARGFAGGPPGEY
jgi:hypothetical protein